jgi:hypothetical protein
MPKAFSPRRNHSIAANGHIRQVITPAKTRSTTFGLSDFMAGSSFLEIISYRKDYEGRRSSSERRAVRGDAGSRRKVGATGRIRRAVY